MEAEELADGAARYIQEGTLPECGLAITGDNMVGQLTPGPLQRYRKCNCVLPYEKTGEKLHRRTVAG